MKKNLLALITCSLSFVAAHATKDTVHVADFQFTPASLNVIVGDTIVWIWDNGSHTTTSTTIPTGAAVWSSPMTSSNKVFQYIVTIAGTYQYKCIPHAAFGMVASFVATAALPVQLTNFAVTNSSTNKAVISWNTLTEQNTSYFAIKRSYDGSNFTEIAKVNAAGNSSVSRTYSYTDNSVGTSSKFVYYSLEIVDKDGRKQATEIKMFKNLLAKAKLIAQLSPNPITSPGHLMLQFNADKAGTMLVQLFDASGKFIKQAEMEAVPGLNNGHFHLGNLPAGLYNIVFTLDGVKETHSVLMK